MIKSPPAGDTGLIPGSGRLPREGNGNPLQYSSFGNPIDRGAWWATYSPGGLRTIWDCRFGHELATKQSVLQKIVLPLRLYLNWEDQIYIPRTIK